MKKKSIRLYGCGFPESYLLEVESKQPLTMVAVAQLERGGKSRENRKRKALRIGYTKCIDALNVNTQTSGLSSPPCSHSFELCNKHMGLPIYRLKNNHSAFELYSTSTNLPS